MTKFRNRMRPIHPGEILNEDVLAPTGMSANALARELRVPVTRISEILYGRRAITADTALRLARYLGATAQFWVNLQASYDLKFAEQTLGKKIAKEIQPRDPVAA